MKMDDKADDLVDKLDRAGTTHDARPRTSDQNCMLHCWVIPRSEYLQSLRMIYGLIDMFEYWFNSEEFYGSIYEA